VGLTFNDDFLLFISKIEVVWFSSIDTDFNWHAGSQMQALLNKESLRLGLEITTNLRITFSPFTLEWFIHLLSLQQW
jgi:hypothetical protein